MDRNLTFRYLERLQDTLPAGRYAIGVSGGVDSTTLLRLASQVPGLWLHVVHVDHQLRGAESAADAVFVRELAQELQLPFHLFRLEELAGSVPPSQNLSSHLRNCRIEAFRRVVREQNLQGVMLGHHLDDQVETVMLKKQRGVGVRSLVGMPSVSRLGELLILRPLLRVRRRTLEEWARVHGFAWREDASNAAPLSARNRLRLQMKSNPRLFREGLRAMVRARRAIQEMDIRTGTVDCGFLSCKLLAEAPGEIARHRVYRWLQACGVRGELPEKTLARVVAMATDATAPRVMTLAGARRVRRSRGSLRVEG
jgi:tRNA(Ile)-lysidine synthetase-like protein